MRRALRAAWACRPGGPRASTKLTKTWETLAGFLGKPLELTPVALFVFFCGVSVAWFLPSTKESRQKAAGEPWPTSSYLAEPAVGVDRTGWTSAPENAQSPVVSAEYLPGSSNREVTFFSVVYFSRGTLPTKKETVKGHYWGT